MCLDLQGMGGVVAVLRNTQIRRRKDGDFEFVILCEYVFVRHSCYVYKPLGAHNKGLFFLTLLHILGDTRKPLIRRPWSL
jgi:hypothetical protein